MLLETAWIIVPLVIALGIFAWGARIYFAAARPPRRRQAVLRRRQAVDVEDRAPRAASARSTSCTFRSGKPVKLKMTSEDVIHSLLHPRVAHQDRRHPGQLHDALVQRRHSRALPPLLRQYCGTEHSGMVGRVIVMEPADYEAWLAAAARPAASSGRCGRGAVPAEACNTCHRPDTSGARPRARRGSSARRSAQRRPDRRSPTKLHPRVDPESGGQDRGRLPAASCRRTRGQSPRKQMSQLIRVHQVAAQRAAASIRAGR